LLLLLDMRKHGQLSSTHLMWELLPKVFFSPFTAEFHMWYVTLLHRALQIMQAIFLLCLCSSKRRTSP
jgi:hypothetical protein